MTSRMLVEPLSRFRLFESKTQFAVALPPERSHYASEFPIDLEFSKGAQVGNCSNQGKRDACKK